MKKQRLKPEIALYLGTAIIVCMVAVSLNIANNRLYDLEMQQADFMEWLERSKMFDWDYVQNNRINGVYHPDKDTYCVWVTNTSYDSQQATERHEYLHYLIDEGECFMVNGTTVSCYEHFCEGVW